MKCPVDGATLQMTERSGVEIDYCPSCRGIWLDRGELDKILERGAEADRANMRPGGGDGEPRRTPVHGHGGDRHHRRKRRGWLSDLLDFD